MEAPVTGQVLNPGDSILVKEILYVNTLNNDGNYYVLIAADYNETVEERLETNNTIAIPLELVTVGNKDVLAISPVLTPEVGAANYPMVLDYLLKNTGTSSISYTYQSQSFAVYYYYSTDATFQEGTDELLEFSYMYSTLAAGGTVAMTRQVLIPSTATEGQNYILAVVDYYDDIAESDETNNVLAIPVLIVPADSKDLRIPEASLNTATAGPGATVTLNFEVKNSGLGITDNNKVGIYFSSDNILDQADSLLSFDNVNSLFEGASDTYENYSVLLSDNLSSGNYYLILKADIENTVEEYDEDNNTKVLALTIDNTLSVKNNGKIQSSIQCYPNPAKDEITFETSDLFSAKENNIIIYNSIGGKVAEQKISNTTFQLNVSSLTPGVYSYSFSKGNERGKFVILR